VGREPVLTASKWVGVLRAFGPVARRRNWRQLGFLETYETFRYEQHTEKGLKRGARSHRARGVASASRRSHMVSASGMASGGATIESS
jgi:hypothetical protein